MSKATIVPIFFTGQNSRLFQLASHLSLTLRLSLVFRETARRIGTRLNVRVGRPVPFSEVAHIEDRNELVMELRKRTYDLAKAEDIRGTRAGLHLREAKIKGIKKQERGIVDPLQKRACDSDSIGFKQVRSELR